MDLVANMLTVIRNAQAVNHESVIIPFSNFKKNIALILEQEGYLKEVEVLKIKNEKNLKIFLNYNEDGSSAITEIKKISKPGQRVYLPYEDIRPYKNSYGIKIISTSKGLLTDKEVRKQKIGGEVICAIF